MTDYTELKRLAEDAMAFAGLNGEVSPAQEQFIASANPKVILALLVENEALRKDAERYQAIRDVIPHDDLGRAVLSANDAADYDAAIDAAIGKGEQS